MKTFVSSRVLSFDEYCLRLSDFETAVFNACALADLANGKKLKAAFPEIYAHYQRWLNRRYLKKCGEPNEN